LYAIIEDGGQQFKVSEGDLVRIGLRELDPTAEKIEFDRVLLVADGKKVKVGTPLVAGAKVVAEVVDAEAAGPKLRVNTYKRRKGYRRKKGHRQKYTLVRISKIQA
jgi:large subunit ribosomal protein L21